jgi:chromosomal replication initiation ATPase DnaA
MEKMNTHSLAENYVKKLHGNVSTMTKTKLIDAYIAGHETGVMNPYSKVEAKKLTEAYGNLKLDDIMEKVSETCEVNVSLIRSKYRKRHIVEARQLYCYIAYRTRKWSLAQIGSSVHVGYDHSSVIHGRNTVTDMLITGNYSTKGKIQDIQRKLGLILEEQ